MKCLLINLIVFVIFVDSDMVKRLFLPQLPLVSITFNYKYIFQYRNHQIATNEFSLIHNIIQLKAILYFFSTGRIPNKTLGTFTL